MIEVAYLQNEEIAEYADRFLREHDINVIPVDIEGVIERRYKMDIIPTPGLRRYIEIDGFITSDASSIYVDDDVYYNFTSRYRFTLAHEIGHLYMHGDILAQYGIRSIDDWKEFVRTLDGRTHSKFEYQANCFAGLILVPTSDLSREFDMGLEAIGSQIAEAKRARIPRSRYVPYILTRVAESICETFDVSSGVVSRRIAFEELDNRIE